MHVWLFACLPACLPRLPVCRDCLSAFFVFVCFVDFFLLFCFLFVFFLSVCAVPTCVCSRCVSPPPPPPQRIFPPLHLSPSRASARAPCPPSAASFVFFFWWSVCAAPACVCSRCGFAPPPPHQRISPFPLSPPVLPRVPRARLVLQALFFFSLRLFSLRFCPSPPANISPPPSPFPLPSFRACPVPA